MSVIDLSSGDSQLIFLYRLQCCSELWKKNFEIKFLKISKIKVLYTTIYKK